jgi:hypothetical protein
MNGRKRGITLQMLLITVGMITATGHIDASFTPFSQVRRFRYGLAYMIVEIYMYKHSKASMTNNWIR